MRVAFDGVPTQDGQLMSQKGYPQRHASPN